jgi:hypothetical protein
MLKIRKKKRFTSKGEPFYQILGPDSKTGKEVLLETVKGPGDLSKRADKIIIERMRSGHIAQTASGILRTPLIASFCLSWATWFSSR